MTPLGVIHGRFQVLHNDHLAYLLEGKRRCEHLVVGITNPDPQLTREDAADPHRSSPLANPLTYFERYTLVRAVLLQAGIGAEEVSVVPFPINLPELWRHYLPVDAVYYLSIYDDWGRRKLAWFQAQGLRTEVLYERPREEKGISGSDVRRRMATGAPWEDLVPTATRRLMVEWRIPARLADVHRSRSGDPT